jgi:DNA-binding beta-propeller fold protein YncE
VFTLTDVGPSNMVMHPDQRRLFVANYNGNSVSVFDLELGTWGQQVGEVNLVGEGPAGMTLTPDGTHLVVANLAGEITDSGLAQSTLAIIDVDEASQTYLEVRTWVTNN